jgi:hypothetical protein
LKVSEVVYHFTDSMRLPWIIETGELRVGQNKRSSLPFDFLWATTNKLGDKTATVLAVKNRGFFREGLTRLVRFSLDAADFMKWSDVPELFSEWTLEHIERSQKMANEIGETNFSAWRCRATPLPLSSAIAAETRTYVSTTWKPFDLKNIELIFPGSDDGCRGIVIEKRAYLATRTTGSNGLTGYYRPASTPWTDAERRETEQAGKLRRMAA